MFSPSCGASALKIRAHQLAKKVLFSVLCFENFLLIVSRNQCANFSRARVAAKAQLENTEAPRLHFMNQFLRGEHQHAQHDSDFREGSCVAADAPFVFVMDRTANKELLDDGQYEFYR